MTDDPQPAILAATPATVRWGYFDAAVPPALTLPSGAVVTIHTVSGDATVLPDDPAFPLLPEHRAILAAVERGPGPHLLTGPVAVAGAEPGDVLQVDILDVRLRQDWAFTLILPLLGTLPDDFPHAVLRHLPLDADAGTVTLPWGGTLRTAPFFGVMGTAPPPHWGRVTSVMPRAFGGNMDNKELVAGTTVLFSVFAPGALFSVGDGHAVQGDGEVSVTAAETALTGTFRLTLRRGGRPLAAPRAETPGHLIAMGFDEDLDNAARQALRDMIRWLGEARGMVPADAYMLCSLAADLRVTQTVNTIKGVHCVLARSALP